MSTFNLIRQGASNWTSSRGYVVLCRVLAVMLFACLKPSVYSKMVLVFMILAHSSFAWTSTSLVVFVISGAGCG